MHVPGHAEADCDRVEETLVVGDEQGRTGSRQVLPAAGAEAEADQVD
jgi:hypothetical protein